MYQRYVPIRVKEQLWQSAEFHRLLLCSRWACKSWQFLG